jgi:hypothetical protein
MSRHPPSQVLQYQLLGSVMDYKVEPSKCEDGECNYEVVGEDGEVKDHHPDKESAERQVRILDGLQKEED